MKLFTLLIDTFKTIGAEFMSIIRPLFRSPKLLAGVIALVFVGLWLTTRSSEPTQTEPSTTIPIVTVGTAAELIGNNSIELIGTVAAKTEANLQAEAGGRVVAVRTTLGQRVGAGAIIAQIENASEQAAVLQAEGAYEAALAAAAQSQVGVAEAETALRSTLQSAVTLFSSSYNSVAGIVRTDLDTYFSNPTSPVPGLRITGYGLTQTINTSRVAIETVLRNWQAATTQLSTQGDVLGAIETGRTYTAAVIELTDNLISALSSDTTRTSVAEDERRARLAALTATRSTLLALQNNFTVKQAEIANAEDTIRRATVAATRSNGVSSADAQIKQALGSLRAAQANLAKTVIRTPISGTVNTISIKTGDFVAPGTPVAVVTNNDGVEVTTFVGEGDLAQFAIGNQVFLRETIPGTVTNVSSGIDAATGKIEIRIATNDSTLKAGDTVRITSEISNTMNEISTNLPILLPLAAVKFSGSDSYVFVVEDNILVRRDVTVGNIRGEQISITDGITIDTAVVLDARGKSTGTQVTIKQN